RPYVREEHCRLHFHSLMAARSAIKVCPKNRRRSPPRHLRRLIDLHVMIRRRADAPHMAV
ncbi:MAG: hypothetical protein ACYCVB_14300, partial [Bacilli bacterium]